MDKDKIEKANNLLIEINTLKEKIKQLYTAKEKYQISSIWYAGTDNIAFNNVPVDTKTISKIIINDLEKELLTKEKELEAL